MKPAIACEIVRVLKRSGNRSLADAFERYRARVRADSALETLERALGPNVPRDMPAEVTSVELMTGALAIGKELKADDIDVNRALAAFAHAHERHADVLSKLPALPGEPPNYEPARQIYELLMLAYR